ncbi:chromate resistance protein ChrB domain-containing protein [Mesorhizobium sp. ORM6]
MEGLIKGLEAQLTEDKKMTEEPAKTATETLAALTGRTWVTRKGVYVDRIACSWLIRRFIDPAAVIRFVPGKDYVPNPGELRFDMFEGEFTHEGDRCSFEVLLTRAGLSDPALRAIGEIVHDIDLKDAKFGREEASGIASLIAGIAMANQDDDQRVAQGAPVFDNLYQYFRKKRA